MATYFNEAYGKGEALLRRPEWKLSQAPYVPGLDGKKMSKSYGNTIPLFLSNKKMKKLVGRIVTDSTPLGEPLSMETCNVFALLKLFCSQKELRDVEGWYRTGKRDGQDFGYGHAKLLLADKIQSHFAEGRARMEELRKNPKEVDSLLAGSAERAREVAQKTMERCRRACGLG
jgi:tryptophanyl-tRNA synthetase